MTKYFHELSNEEYQVLLDEHITCGELEGRYPQPPWCVYPGALQGQYGYWALLDRKIKKKENCENCEYCKKEEEKNNHDA